MADLLRPFVIDLTKTAMKLAVAEVVTIAQIVDLHQATVESRRFFNNPDQHVLNHFEHYRAFHAMLRATDQLGQAISRKLLAKRNPDAPLEPEHRHHLSLSLYHLEDVCLVLNAAHASLTALCPRCGGPRPMPPIPNILYCAACEQAWANGHHCQDLPERRALLDLRQLAAFHRLDFVTGERRE